MDSEVKIGERVEMPPEAKKAEPPEDGYSDFLKQDEWYGTDIKPYVLDHADEYERPDFMFIKDGKPFAPLGSICSITGQPGHGKTTTFSIFMTAVIRGECCGIKYNLSDKYEKPRVLYIDTEMEKGNTQKVIRRIYKMCGYGRDQRDALKDQLFVLRLREVDDVQQRWKIVLEAIYEIRPLAVFLDGFLDMVSDFNDNRECLTAIYKHMSVSTKYECVLWDLVHQNPNSDKMVGHGGSFIQRKGADIFQTKKVKEMGAVHFEVAHVKARGQDQDDWMYKMVDDNDYIGTPVLLGENYKEDIQTEAEVKRRKDDVKSKLSWMSASDISYTKLRETIKKNGSIGSGTADEIIKDGVKFGILEQLENNRYRLKLTPDGTETTIADNSIGDDTEEMPF